MFVENTTSPSALPVVPYAAPRNTVPSSSTSTASARSVTAAVILVPPSSLCGTPAPGRRHDGHHNDPSYLLQPFRVHRDVVGLETRTHHRATELPGAHQQRSRTHDLARHTARRVDPSHPITRNPETDGTIPVHLDPIGIPA